MLFEQLQRRESQGRPIRIGVIGAGTFGTQIVAQTCRMQGMRVSMSPPAAGAAFTEIKNKGGGISWICIDCTDCCNCPNKNTVIIHLSRTLT